MVTKEQVRRAVAEASNSLAEKIVSQKHKLTPTEAILLTMIEALEPLSAAKPADTYCSCCGAKRRS